MKKICYFYQRTLRVMDASIRSIRVFFASLAARRQSKEAELIERIRECVREEIDAATRRTDREAFRYFQAVSDQVSDTEELMQKIVKVQAKIAARIGQGQFIPPDEIRIFEDYAKIGVKVCNN